MTPEQSKILNYTTSVPAKKSIAEIQDKLARAGAKAVLQEYNGACEPNGLSFKIQTQFGEMAFRLPAEIDKVAAVLNSGRKRQAPSPWSSRETQAKHAQSLEQRRTHAVNVSWRILKDWIEAQIALMRSGMITVEQAFLPYCQGPDGQTVYESLRDRKFSQYALTEGSNESA